MQKSYQVGAYNMQNDERIPNLASEFKSDKIWPFFGQKLSKWAKSDILSISNSFFCQKMVKSNPIWILRPDLESSHHFAHFGHPFDMIFAFWFSYLQWIFKNLKLNLRPLKMLETDFSRTIELSVSETMWNRFPKLVFFEQP